MLSTQVIDATRTRLGQVGVWRGSRPVLAVDEAQRFARQVEDLGYGSLWAGERVGGQEAFAYQALMLAATDRLVAGTGIANVWARHPAAMEGGASTLGAGYPGRFILGIGISHAPAIAASGQTYDKPMARMVAYLDAMDQAAAEETRPPADVPRLLAALRPQMLALSRDRGDGAHPYFVPPAHTALAREVLGPDKLLIPEQAVVLASDPAEARRRARAHMEMYLRLPNYVNNLHHLGYRDEDVAGAGSDRLVDAIVAWGEEAAVAARVREHLDAGADHVVLQALGDHDEALAQLAVLAPAVLQG